MAKIGTAPLAFTPMALAAATNHGGLESVSVRLRADLMENIENPELQVKNLVFHIVESADEGGPEYMIWPSKDGERLMVDIAEWFEMEPLTEGPLVGKVMYSAIPASQAQNGEEDDG